MEQINFQHTIERLKDTGFSPIPNVVKVTVPDAKRVLWAGIRYFTGENARWLPEYEEVAGWLAGNEGRGLLCFGNCGRGKTLICGKILPLVLNHYCRKVVSCYDAQQMNADLDAVKQKHIIYVDDIGTENLSVKYGEKRLAFAELADEAEKKGKLLILTTNLTIDELREKYGERTIDRLRAITKTVLFSGESLRK
jgi:DNA replication protein DnaC